MICPLLTGTAAGSSLRADQRTGVWGIFYNCLCGQLVSNCSPNMLDGPSQAHWGQVGPIPIGTAAFPPCRQLVQSSWECRTAGVLQLPVGGVRQHTPSQRCDVPAPSKWPQQQHRLTSETSQEWHQCVACQEGLFFFLLTMLLCGQLRFENSVAAKVCLFPCLAVPDICGATAKPNPREWIRCTGCGEGSEFDEQRPAQELDRLPRNSSVAFWSGNPFACVGVPGGWRQQSGP